MTRRFEQFDPCVSKLNNVAVLCNLARGRYIHGKGGNAGRLARQSPVFLGHHNGCPVTAVNLSGPTCVIEVTMGNQHVADIFGIKPERAHVVEHGRNPGSVEAINKYQS